MAVGKAGEPADRDRRSGQDDLAESRDRAIDEGLDEAAIGQRRHEGLGVGPGLLREADFLCAEIGRQGFKRDRLVALQPLCGLGHGQAFFGVFRLVVDLRAGNGAGNRIEHHLEQAVDGDELPEAN